MTLLPLLPDEKAKVKQFAIDRLEVWLALEPENRRRDIEAIQTVMNLLKEQRQKIADLERDRDDHQKNRELLAKDLSALAKDEPVKTLLAEQVAQKVKKLEESGHFVGSRYLLFVYNSGHACGGWQDFWTDFDSQLEAETTGKEILEKSKAGEYHYYDQWHIVDRTTGHIIVES